MVYNVEQRGLGKPDYSQAVSSGISRSGIKLQYNQSLKLFSIVFSGEHTGVHTAAVNLTIMTDATANFIPSSLLGLTILNVTDGSYGTIIANTTTTITVFFLTGGVSDQWNNLDVYYVPSPFAWIQTSLAVGATAHCVDNDTGLSLPYNIPKGYCLTFIAAGAGFTENVIAWFYIDNYLVMNGGVSSAWNTVYENRVVGISTADLDPEGLSAHTFDIQLTNRGAAAVEGGAQWTMILQKI